MRRGWRIGPVFAVAVLGAAVLDPGAASPSTRRPRPHSSPADAGEVFGARGRASLPFPALEPNLGQADASVGYVGRVPGITALLSPAEACLLVGGPRGGGRRKEPSSSGSPARVRIRFPGSARGAAMEPAGALPGRSHYFLGRDPAGWVAGVPRYSRVRVRGIFPGVDLQYETRADGLEYRFLVSPGADPGGIALAVEGAEDPALDGTGALVLRTSAGVLRHSPPLLFQDIDGARSPVSGRFASRGAGLFGFEVGPYDRHRPLVIDPLITFSSLLGGSLDDIGLAVAIGPEGDVFVVGESSSTDFPRKDPLQGSFGGVNDVTVTRVNAAGTLVYSTYLGGSGEDRGWGVAVDGSGAAFVAGYTQSTDFPLQGALQGAFGGGASDVFVTAVHPTGASLLYSTYLGGSGEDTGYRIALATGGAAVIVGRTGSTDFPLQSPLQGSFGGGPKDAFVARIDPQGTSLDYSTFLGGSGYDAALGVAVSSSGDVFVAGNTMSSDFPVVNAFQPTLWEGNQDAFVARLDGAASRIVYSTYLGGSATDHSVNLAVDGTGAAYVVGYTYSANFPVRNPIQASNRFGDYDGFVAKLAPPGSSLDYATYLGGSGVDEVNAIAVTADGSALVAGLTGSSDFPTENTTRTSLWGLTDGFECLLQPDGGGFFHSSFFGGIGVDGVLDAAVDGSGLVCLAGGTNDSSSFPLLDAFQPGYAGGILDGFLTMMHLAPPAAPAGLSAASTADRQITLSWTNDGGTETVFAVERRSGEEEFRTVAHPGAGATSFTDTALRQLTTYTYRVRARNADGQSAPTNEASADTPLSPTAPWSPFGVTASPGSVTEIVVTWEDGSDNEDEFEILRRIGTEPPAVAGTVPAGTLSFRDSGLFPGRRYGYRVRATNAYGGTESANEAIAVLGSTFRPALLRGSLTDSGKAGRDRAKLTAALPVGGTSFDPAVDVIAFAAGDEEGPISFAVAAGSDGWKSRRGRWSWRSPRGSAVKVKAVVDPAAGNVSVSVAGTDFPVAPANPVWVWLGLGGEGGWLREYWTQGRPGAFAYP